VCLHLYRETKYSTKDNPIPSARNRPRDFCTALVQKQSGSIPSKVLDCFIRSSDVITEDAFSFLIKSPMIHIDRRNTFKLSLSVLHCILNHRNENARDRFEIFQLRNSFFRFDRVTFIMKLIKSFWFVKSIVLESHIISRGRDH